MLPARHALAVGLLTAAASLALGQEPVRGARHSALSPDGQWLAFGWRGELWKVASAAGRAEWLTVHPVRELLGAIGPARGR